MLRPTQYHWPLLRVRARVMVFNATFNNISVTSWRSVLSVEETGVLGKNQRPPAPTLSKQFENLIRLLDMRLSTGTSPLADHRNLNKKSSDFDLAEIKWKTK
jgi:hypothetical protein